MVLDTGFLNPAAAEDALAGRAGGRSGELVYHLFGRSDMRGERASWQPPCLAPRPCGGSCGASLGSLPRCWTCACSLTAGSGVAETAYELGAALCIALLGSIVTGVYCGFTAPDGVPADTTEAAYDSLGGAITAAASLPPGQAETMPAAARDAFTQGFQTAAAIGAVALAAATVATRLLLRGLQLDDDQPDQA